MHQTLRGRRRAGVFVAAGAALAISLTGVAPAAADAPVPESQGLRKAVTLEGVRAHQQAWQAIADADSGNRLAGTAAYDASADYVQARLQAAGYTVTRQTFEFVLNADATPAVLAQTSPTVITWTEGPDYQSMTYSGNGDVTAPVVAVDLLLPPPPGAGNVSTSGCEAADFAGFPAGAIALMQRGTCTFGLKADNAAAAGAVGAVIFNEGQVGRTAVLSGTLGPPTRLIPVIGTTFAIGQTLAGAVLNGPTGASARVRVDRINEVRPTSNVFAETSGDPSNVVVVGAHLDSVSRGPGINDNGSGSAAILELAEVMAARGILPRNKVRFAWWGAEEQGLIGSTYYVNSLSQQQIDDIALNLNFDMVGSPNFVRFVYDGDNSAFPVGPGAAAGPDGSGEIERVFHEYFSSQGLASSETPFSGRSDYGPFIAEGIPAGGGLFTGAEGVKTPAEAAIYGGTAGVAYDPCYHLACDTYANNSDTVLDQNSDAIAHTVLYFAKRNFAKSPLVNPAAAAAGVSAATGGGGLHDDHEELAS